MTYHKFLQNCVICNSEQFENDYGVHCLNPNCIKNIINDEDRKKAIDEWKKKQPNDNWKYKL